MKLDAREHFKQIPKIRPMFNVGCMFDIPTGKYHTGKHGESILCGGHAAITGVCGRGNAFKSTLSHYFQLVTLDRYESSNGMVYDSEFSLTNGRLEHLYSGMPNLIGRDLFEEHRLTLTDGATMGNEYWESIKDYGEAKVKAGKGIYRTTPFLDEQGNPLKILAPSVVEIDSMSMMSFDGLENIYDKSKGVDDKDMNTEALRSNLFKNRMLVQMPSVTVKYGYYMTVVAHMGDDLALDPMAPPAKKLAFLKQKLKFKQVPEKFTFLTNNLYYAHSAKVLMNQADKTPQFPRDINDRRPGDTDLQEITVQNLRAKSGPTGLPWKVAVSQSDGLLPGLTQLINLRETKKVRNDTYKMGFGIGGHDQGYFLDIVPDVKLTRTTVRGIIDTDPAVARGMEITSELMQMYLLWKDIPEHLICTPAQLFEDIKNKGYDWNQLLTETRGYWVFEEDEEANPLKFLSTMDLLKMRAGEYHPYWLPKK